MLIRLILCLTLLAGPVSAQAEPPMTPERLAAILLAVDPEAASAGSGVSLTIADVPVLVVFDVAANRMRAMVPVASSAGLTEADLMRMMQANFDTALDARYAVANDRLWSVYIHPLRELQREQLISGLAQTVTLARTYGTLYSGGAQVFGGGDSSGLYRELLEELRDRGQEL
jgi:hypothetical protein